MTCVTTIQALARLHPPPSLYRERWVRPTCIGSGSDNGELGDSSGRQDKGSGSGLSAPLQPSLSEAVVQTSCKGYKFV